MRAQAHVLSGEIGRKVRFATLSAELRRGVAAGVVLYGVGVVARTLSEVVFARLMGPREFGAYSYVFAWLSILAVAGGLGIPYALVRFIPEYEVFKDFGAQRRLARFARLLALASGCLLGVLGTAAILAIRPTGVDTVSILVGMATVPLLALLTVQTELARGLRRVVLAYLPFFVVRPVATLVVALAFLAGASNLTARQGLSAGVLAIIVCLVVQRARVHKLLAAHPSEEALASAPSGDAGLASTDRRLWLRVALPLLVINLLQQIAMRADVIIVGAFRGSQVAGVYAAAARVALLSTFALEALNTIVAPTLAKLYFAKDVDAMRRLVQTTARITFGTSLAATLLLELAGTRSLAVFGSGFTGGMTALQVLLIGQLVSASTGPVVYLMIATGEQNLAALAQAASTALFVVTAIPLTAQWGMVGTAVAVTLGRSTINIWMAVAAQRRLGVRAFVF
jgi:O-antigen/teichoic acid export membrane protein